MIAKVIAMIEKIKQKITDFFSRLDGQYSPGAEIGMEVHEVDDYAADDDLENQHAGKEKLAVAESTKERVIDKIKSNLIYIVIGVLLIIPGLFKLIGFFQEPALQPGQIARAVPFGGEQRAAEPRTIPQDSLESLLNQEKQIQVSADSVPPRKVTLSREEAEVHAKAQPSSSANTTSAIVSAAGEVPVAAKDAISTLTNWLSFGSGSDESSATITQKATENIEDAPVVSKVTTPPAEQILQKYLAAENDMQHKLDNVIERMAKLEAASKIATGLAERMAAKESSKSQLPVDGEQLKLLRSTVIQLEKNVDSLAQEVAKTAKNVAQLMATTTLVNQSTTSADVSPSMVLTVEAVVPGRAWIRDAQGVLMVVQVGDEISGIGKVTRIDARDGTVATATRVFRQ